MKTNICTNKINICFAIIPPRFKNIEKLVESFQLQTLNFNKIIITLPKKYHKFSYQKEEIESICIKYHNLVHLLYLDEDYGPANKIYGALKSLELYPNSSVMVCDDDAIYDERLLECYSKALQTNNTCVWTTDKDKDDKHAQYKKSYGVNGNYLVLPHHNIPKLQGVDTFIFTSNILKKINSNNFKEKYIDFLQKNTNKKSLDDVFLHDDYFISILLYDLKIPVGFFYLRNPIYNIIKSDGQIHESIECHSDEVELMQRIYQNYENLNPIIQCNFTKVDGEKVGEFVIDGELNVNKYHEYIVGIHGKYGPFKIQIEIKEGKPMNGLLDKKTTDIQEFYDWQIKWERMPDEHIDYLFKLKYHYRFEPKVIYDIGSNYLSWYKLASNVWKESKIYCFDAFSGFENVYPRYDIDYALELLSDSEEEVKFHENPMSPGLNSLYMVNEEYDFGKNFHNQHLNTTIRKTRTLDSVCKEKNWEKPDLIKMDVQGAEVKVLKGAQEVIKNCNHLILEVQTKEFSLGAPMLKDVEEYMQSIGFVLFTSMSTNRSSCDGDYHFVRQSILHK
jgi:FkbM family methyltransferase